MTARHLVWQHRRDESMTVKVTTNPVSGWHHGGRSARTMSVTLINIFEVPAGDEDEFIAA